jgi:hypothetical protein
LIEKLLREVSKELYFAEQASRSNNLFKYAQMREHYGWSVHQKFLVLIANKLSEYMLSKEFSELDGIDMKANQLAMRMTKEIINFLFDPLKGAKNVLKTAAHNKRMGATQKGATEGRKK